jgi:nitroreductase
MAAQPDTTSIPELVRTVRQARQYRPDPVPDDVVRTLLEVARWTGSSRNTQPWHFIVITDREQLRRISELRAPINWVADAPLGIAIVLDGENAAGEAYDEGRVTERILIAARSLGLGGGVAWYGDPSQQAEGKRILGIPEDKVARSVVIVGYATSTKDPRPNPRAGGRKELSEIVSYNRMGQSKG